MIQAECTLGMKVVTTKHPDRTLFVRENHNPKGAGLSSSMDTPAERSFFVLYDFLITKK